MAVSTADPQYFGSEAQVKILKRGRALFDVLQGDGRFSSHGRVMGIISPDHGPVRLLARLAELQGASHYALVGAQDTETLLDEIAAANLHATHYARWETDLTQVAADHRRAAFDLPEGVTIQRLTAQTPADLVRSFAQMSLACGVLPAWLSAHRGEVLRSRTLLAVTETGRVVSSAYASSYITDGSALAQRECFWGMLATDPEWRGRRLSLALGGRLLSEMHQDFGFTACYTGIEPGNTASEAACHKLGLRKSSNSIITVADAAQLPGGRMTK